MPLAPCVPEEIIPLVVVVVEELCLLLLVSRMLDCQVLSLARKEGSCG